MGISYIIAGFVFFFLPNFNIMDLLPDFIGCILIIKGLYKLADLTPGLMDAKLGFIKVLYVYLAKFFLMFSVPFFGNSKGGGGYILIFTFTFAIFDFTFTLPAFMSLLNGFTYLGDRTNAKVIFNNQSEFSTLTSLFIIVRAVLAVIPDLSFISNPEYSGVVTSQRSFYISDYKNLLYGLNFLVTTLIGIVWLFYAVRYFTAIKKDVSLMSILEDKYKIEILTNEGLFIRRNIKKAFLFLTIGAVLMLDLQIDLVNVIPDFLGGLMFLLSALTFKKYCKDKLYIYSSAVYLLISLVSWIISCSYAIKYPAVNIWSNFDAYDFFIKVNIANAIQYISLAVVLFSIFKNTNKIIDLYTGSPIDELKTVYETNKLKQKGYKRSNYTVFILGIVCVLYGITRIVLLYDFGEFAIFDVISNLIWISYLYKTLNSVNSAVEYRYL